MGNCVQGLKKNVLRNDSAHDLFRVDNNSSVIPSSVFVALSLEYSQIRNRSSVTIAEMFSTG